MCVVDTSSNLIIKHHPSSIVGAISSEEDGTHLVQDKI